jgi:hypothetical protein
MLSPASRVAPHHRGAVAAGICAAILAVALAASAVLSLNAPNAGARAAREAGERRVAHLGPVSALTPTSPVGMPTSYYQPPPVADPSRPAILDNMGWDQPDPFVFAQSGTYYLFTSRSNEPQNVPVQSGTAFGQWGSTTDALPDPPAWAMPDVMWAPDVAQFGSHYILYFTSQLVSQSQHTMCIGDAVSTNPAGPYISSPVPFICQLSLGGSIDPRVFVDDNGQPYMVWKSDENSRSWSFDTQIWSQRLSADGTQLVGAPAAIFRPDEPWQHTVVEAPQLEKVNGNYYLFYSAGAFTHPSYAIGAARCSGPTGPCYDTSSTPLLGSNLQGWGPGEESLFTNATGFWMVYSPWFANMDSPGPPRPVALVRLGFGPKGAYLAAPFASAPPATPAPATRAP